MKQCISFLSQMCLPRDPQQFGVAGRARSPGPLETLFHALTPTTGISTCTGSAHGGIDG